MTIETYAAAYRCPACNQTWLPSEGGAVRPVGDAVVYAERHPQGHYACDCGLPFAAYLRGAPVPAHPRQHPERGNSA
jgi:hypothetical protein